ncbi:MAG: NrdH-redoxin, partial [Gammaproteobacteria bacterium]
MKEYLSVRGIEFESINVLDDDAGMATLRELGARSVPVVSQGAKYVFAQVLQDVVDFLGLDDNTGPTLSPAALAERYQHVLTTAVRLTRQMPNDQLSNELPNRPRSWRVLMHHVFQIPNAFMDARDNGTVLQYTDMVAPPPDDMLTVEHIAEFGESIRQRFEAWWARSADDDFSARVEVYFGETSLHDFFERTVWHSTQHVRQVASLLERAGVEPDSPLTSADIEGLPLTEK